MGAPADDAAATESYGCCHARRHFRWALLPLICLLTFGSYFSYDNPAALENKLVLPVSQGGLDMSMFQVNLLYSLYSWPNTVLAFLGGILIDKVLGINLGGFIFGSLILVGQVVVSVGSMIGSVPTMYAGRFIFGLGGENLAVAQNSYTVKWFKGRELNMVFGLGLSISRIGSTINMNAEMPIAMSYGIATAFWVGAVLCAVSVFDGLVLWFLDRRGTKQLGVVKAPSSEKISFRYILNFPLTLWLIFFICVFFYVGIFPFIGIAPNFFVSKWPELADQAGTIASLPYLISGFASPVFGILVDRTGYNPFWVMVASAVVYGCHALLTFTWVTPYVAMSLIGLAYSLCACALWPMVGYLVADEFVGTAYGLMQSIQNLGLAVVPLAVGVLTETYGGTADIPNYLPVNSFFLACIAESVVLAVALMVIDRTLPSPCLMLSATELRAKREQELAAAAAVNESSQIVVKSDDTVTTIGPTPGPLRSRASMHLVYLGRLGIYADKSIGLPHM